MRLPQFTQRLRLEASFGHLDIPRHSGADHVDAEQRQPGSVQRVLGRSVVQLLVLDGEPHRASVEAAAVRLEDRNPPPVKQFPFPCQLERQCGLPVEYAEIKCNHLCAVRRQVDFTADLALADAHFHDAAERLPETVAETVFRHGRLSGPPAELPVNRQRSERCRLFRQRGIFHLEIVDQHFAFACLVGSEDQVVNDERSLSRQHRFERNEDLPPTAAGDGSRNGADLFPVAPFQIQTDAAGKSLRIHPQPESDGVPIQKRFVNLVLIGVAFAVVLQEIEFKASAPAVVAGRVLGTAERAPVTLRVRIGAGAVIPVVGADRGKIVQNHPRRGIRGAEHPAGRQDEEQYCPE